MDIGQAIKALRTERGWTQGQLAERCEMSTNAVCSIETGKAYPPKGTIERFCRALGVPVASVVLASIEDADFPEEKRVLCRALFEPLKKELITTEER